MDMVITGGNVLTMDGRDRRAGAIAIEGGKIAAVGAGEEISKLVGPQTKVVRLGGRTLMPGFIDPHNHFSLTTFQPASVDCSVPPHDSVKGVLDAIANAAGGQPPGRWIWGWGFRSALVKEGRPVTRGELDEAAPDNPVSIMDGSVHACYSNSAALQLAGIDRHTPDPPGGEIRKDGKGEPDGTLWEQAMDPVYRLSFRAHLDHYGEEAADLVYHNCMRHAALGITSVGDALVVPEAAEMYRLADGLGKLPIVVHQMFGGDGFFAPPEKAAKGGAGAADPTDRLRGGTVKIFMDPVFPSPALMRFHPGGAEEHHGQRYYTQEEADALVLAAHGRGFQVAIHCLGTWSVEQALNAFERAQREHPRPEPRFRIEHYSLPNLAQIRRTKELGVVASIQPPFVFTNGAMSKSRAEASGGDVRAFPFKTMLSEGLTVSASSDSPCAPVNPMLGLGSIVTRMPRSGGAPVEPEEAVTPLEGLRMYTIDAAYAMSREGEVGSLEKGKRADLAVLSHDPTAVNGDFIRDIQVDQTYIDGRLVWER